MKKKILKARKGFSLVELLIAVVVLGILGAMLLAAGTAAQTKARVAVASNDIDSVRNAVYTAFTMKTGFMQMKDNETTFKQVVDAINAELDENWKWDLLPAAQGTNARSGAIAQTAVQRDPWGNPYTMFVYTDTHTTKYASGRGTTADEWVTHLVDSDSCIYLVIASAGPNGTGVGMGIAGDAGTDATNMVNNTDGIDDIGVVIRMLNGSTSMATFGWANGALGTLEYINWYFCGSGGSGSEVNGVWSSIDANGSVTPLEGSNAPGYGTSLDVFPNLENLNKYQLAKNADKNNPCHDWEDKAAFGSTPVGGGGTPAGGGEDEA